MSARLNRSGFEGGSERAERHRAGPRTGSGIIILADMPQCSPPRGSVGAMRGPRRRAGGPTGFSHSRGRHGPADHS